MIYADYNATTPCLPEVAELVRHLLVDDFGNPSQRSSLTGRKARAHLDTAREQVATALQAREDEIMFTSGATEACNTAILGVMQRLLTKRPRILVAATEHSAVLEPVAYCGQAGAEVITLSVDTHGVLSLDALKANINDQTALVCVMAVNNETGVTQDLPAIRAVCEHHGALFFCDMTQALGKLPIDLSSGLVDFAAFSAHKIYGPKGSGALFKRRGLSLPPLLRGGGQEEGLRSGTENMPGIAGFGLAAAIASKQLGHRRHHVQGLSEQLESSLRKGLPGLIIHGESAPRAPGTSMVSLSGLSSAWLPQLGDIVASSGSACASQQGKASHVLQAMGLDETTASRSLRISLGVPSTAEEVEIIAQRMIEGARRILR